MCEEMECVEMKKLIDKFCSTMNRISCRKLVNAPNRKFDIVPVRKLDAVPASSCVEPALVEVALYAKTREILDEVRNCSLVSWDLWEMGNLVSPQVAIYDFDNNDSNRSIANNRIKYCDNKDTFMSEMMGLSLAHDFVDIKLVKSMDGTHGIIMVLFCVNGEGTTNIDADLIDLLASTSGGAYV
jgi:hypothetical protein